MKHLEQRTRSALALAAASGLALAMPALALAEPVAQPGPGPAGAPLPGECTPGEEQVVCVFDAPGRHALEVPAEFASAMIVATGAHATDPASGEILDLAATATSTFTELSGILRVFVATPGEGGASAVHTEAIDRDARFLVAGGGNPLSSTYADGATSSEEADAPQVIIILGAEAPAGAAPAGGAASATECPGLCIEATAEQIYEAITTFTR
ncbi:hypothetical protein HT102_09805 [Hoyosella sp. G463]|uniref:Uncharacterized protein n=1 Tax=Lolliginicoccus lacisalsi TaxID=2742202 RepID=A0A927PMT0_9ACTN|nr:hypothetical protein [Lolliginicoccus lacisalsi]MBD8506781.1 hypothetical protein [Lolliginicoccus lacisalsi]